MNDKPFESRQDFAPPWCGYCTGQTPTYPSLVTAGGTISYSQLANHISDAMRSLEQLGLRPGQRIVLDDATDRFSWTVALLAAMNVGAQVVITGSDWSPSVRRALLKNLDVNAFFDSDFKVRFSSAQLLPSSLSLEPGVWLFTSGTTKNPKARFRSVKVLSAMIERLKKNIPQTMLTQRPSVLVLAPISHGFGLLNGLLLVLALGGTAILSENVDAATAIDLGRRHEAFGLYAWPMHYQNIVESNRSVQGFFPRWCVSSSFALDPKIAQAFLDKIGCIPRQQYGMTETGPLCLDSGEASTIRPYCVGQPLSGIELCVRNDAGQLCPNGETGSIFIKISDPAPDLPGRSLDGWWNTQDIGYMDDNELVYILRRAIPYSDERKDF